MKEIIRWIIRDLFEGYFEGYKPRRTDERNLHARRLIAATRARVNWSAIDRACHDRLTRAICLETAARPISARDYSRFSPWRKNSLIGISMDVSRRTHCRRGYLENPSWKRFSLRFPARRPALTTPETLWFRPNEAARRGLANKLWNIYWPAIPLMIGIAGRRLVATALRHRSWFPSAACSQIW